MIKIPENFSKMSWLQLLVVCLKIIIYFDTADISELNEQVGGATTDITKNDAKKEKEATSTTNNKAVNTAASTVENEKKEVTNTADSSSNNNESKNNNKGNESVSSEESNTQSIDPSSNNKKKSTLDDALKTDMSDDKDLQNQRPGFLNNNWIVFALKELMKLVRNIFKTVTSILSKLFAKFIFAATFPAFPFFLIMGSMYSFVKYAAFKLREI